MRFKVHKRLQLAKAVREAIDSYPEGLCFSSSDGKPILVNTQMNRLISTLTGHTIIETDYLWNALRQIQQTPSGCQRVTPRNTDYISENANKLIFRFPDGKIWRFERTVLPGEEKSTIQFKADDITALYSVSEELDLKNQRLLALTKRQKDMLSDIVGLNRDKEFLAAKMKIHDDFGRCLVATKKAISEGSLAENMEMLINGWQSAISGMSVIPLQQKENSPHDELMKVADMIGCHINMTGKQPEPGKALNLLYSAIREALTNAVRHAGANELTVELSHSEDFCHAEIYSNGSPGPQVITEGVGLGSLRRSLEQNGGFLRIDCSSGVRLIVDIPE